MNGAVASAPFESKVPERVDLDGFKSNFFPAELVCTGLLNDGPKSLGFVGLFLHSSNDLHRLP